MAAGCTSSPYIIRALVDAYPDGVHEVNQVRSHHPHFAARRTPPHGLRAQAGEMALHKAAYNVSLPVVRAVLEAYPEALHVAQAVRAPPLPRRPSAPCPHLAPFCSGRLQPTSARRWSPAPRRGVSRSCTTAIPTWLRCSAARRRGLAGSLDSSPLPGDAHVASRPRSSAGVSLPDSP